MTVTTSPLVSAYLADLDRALAGADPGDRAEIVDAVREHIDTAVAELGAAPSQAEIAGVLRRLGSADTVASAWAVGERTTSPWAAASATTAAPSGPPVPLPYGAGGSDRPAPPDAGPAHVPSAPAASKLPTWATVLLIGIGVVVLAPPLMAIVVALFLIPFRGGLPGWLGIGTSVVLIATSVACLRVARRTERHRRAWLVSGIVGLVLAVPLVVTAIGLAGYTGRASSGGPAVTVYEETPAAVTPLPMG